MNSDAPDPNQPYWKIIARSEWVPHPWKIALVVGVSNIAMGALYHYHPPLDVPGIPFAELSVIIGVVNLIVAGVSRWMRE